MTTVLAVDMIYHYKINDFFYIVFEQSKFIIENYIYELKYFYLFLSAFWTSLRISASVGTHEKVL